MNIALIGLGMVAGTHIAAIRHAGKDIRLTGVLGRNTDRTQAFAKGCAEQMGHDVAAFETVQQIADDPAIDAVIVATPPNARADIVTALTQARKPILMEKPVERDLTAARRIVERCEETSTPLGIVFQHRARAASIALKQALERGVLGDIVTVDLRVPWWRDQGYYDAPGRGSFTRDGGGVMISQAIHTLDLVLWLLGPMTGVQAMMRTTPLHRLEAEDWAGALFEMENGAVGTLMATTAAYPGAAESITLQGTRAAAHLAAGVLTISYLDGRVDTHGAAATTGGGADPMGFTHAWHQTVIEDFVDAVQSGRAPMATGRSALQSHAVIDAMETASRTGQTTRVPRT